MARPIRHLREVVAETGTPNGTEAIMAVVEKGLRALRDQEKAERAERKGTTLKTNPHISDAGKCSRRVTLSLLNIAETNSPDTDALIRFMVGHAFEEAMAEIFTGSQGATYFREESIAIPIGRTKATGRKDFDAVRVATDDSIIELKSTNPRSMAFLLKRGTPNDDHKSQLNLYLVAANKPFGYLVYGVMGSTKGEPILHAWRIDRDDELAGKDLAALSAAYENSLTGTLPPIPEGYSLKYWECQYCPYKNACWRPDSNLEEMLEASLAKAKKTD